MKLPRIFARNLSDDHEGTQVEDHIYQGKRLRIITSFDDYYSSYGALHFEKSNPTDVLDGDTRLLVKHLFTLPFSIPYIVNNNPSIVQYHYPDVFWVMEWPKKVKVPVELIKEITRYCEDQSIYDKLSQYGDFYYKLKRLIRHV